MRPARALTLTRPQNAMAAPVIMMIAVGSNEYSVLRTSYISTPAVLALGAGCVMGLAMNYFSWRLRELVSATSVTVIGARFSGPMTMATGQGTALALSPSIDGPVSRRLSRVQDTDWV